MTPSFSFFLTLFILHYYICFPLILVNNLFQLYISIYIVFSAPLSLSFTFVFVSRFSYVNIYKF